MYGKTGRKPAADGFDDLLIADTRTEYVESVLLRPNSRAVSRQGLGVEDIVDDFTLVLSPSPNKTRPSGFAASCLSSGRLSPKLVLDDWEAGDFASENMSSKSTRKQNQQSFTPASSTPSNRPNKKNNNITTPKSASSRQQQVLRFPFDSCVVTPSATTKDSRGNASKASTKQKSLPFLLDSHNNITPKMVPKPKNSLSDSTIMISKKKNASAVLPFPFDLEETDKITPKITEASWKPLSSSSLLQTVLPFPSDDLEEEYGTSSASSKIVSHDLTRKQQVLLLLSESKGNDSNLNATLSVQKQADVLSFPFDDNCNEEQKTSSNSLSLKTDNSVITHKSLTDAQVKLRSPPPLPRPPPLPFSAFTPKNVKEYRTPPQKTFALSMAEGNISSMDKIVVVEEQKAQQQQSSSFPSPIVLKTQKPTEDDNNDDDAEGSVSLESLKSRSLTAATAVTSTTENMQAGSKSNIALQAEKQRKISTPTATTTTKIEAKICVKRKSENTWLESNASSKPYSSSSLSHVASTNSPRLSVSSASSSSKSQFSSISPSSASPLTSTKHAHAQSSKPCPQKQSALKRKVWEETENVSSKTKKSKTSQMSKRSKTSSSSCSSQISRASSSSSRTTKTITQQRIKNLSHRSNSMLLVELLLGIQSSALKKIRKQLLSPSLASSPYINNMSSNDNNSKNNNAKAKIAWKIRRSPPLSEDRSLLEPPPLCIVQHLLKEGADPNFKDADGYSALYLSLRFKGAEAFEEILAAGGEVLGAGRVPGDPCRYRSLVDYCLLLGQAMCIPALLQKGALPTAVGSLNLPRLSTVARAYNFLDTSDCHLQTALTANLGQGDVNRLRPLLQHHSNPRMLLRAKNKNGLCAVAVCLKNSLNPDVLQLLLEEGGDVNALDQHDTPVAVSLLLRHGTSALRCLEILCKFGLNPKLAVEPGVSLIHFAREHAVRPEAIALFDIKPTTL